MCSRNIDFFAVLVITLAMLGFSKLASLRVPDALDPIRLQNAIHVESCPLPGEILSRLAYILRP